MAFERAEAERREKERREEEERRQREIEKIMRAAEKAKSEEKQEALIEKAVMVEAAPPPEIQTVKVQGAHTRDNWKFEIVDMNQVPTTFSGVVIRTLDATAVRKLVSAGVRSIPGLRIYNDPIAVIR